MATSRFIHEIFLIYLNKIILINIKTINDGVNIYRQFYSKKDEEKYGIIAIKIKII